VLGHIAAVYLAHLRAGERFKTASNALLSQYLIGLAGDFVGAGRCRSPSGARTG